MNKTCIDEKNDRPVVVGYMRVSPDPDSKEPTLEIQQASIQWVSKQLFPQGFLLILIADEASGDLSLKHEGLEPGQYRQGLTYLAELIARGAVQHVCTYQFNQLTTSLSVWQEFTEGYLVKYGVSFIVSAELLVPTPF